MLAPPGAVRCGACSTVSFEPGAFEDDVRAAWQQAARLLYAANDVAGRRVERGRRAKAFSEFAFGRAAGHEDDFGGAREPRQLDHEHPDHAPADHDRRGAGPDVGEIHAMQAAGEGLAKRAP